jgi:antitoxin component YwqK of YwqJK toxin-antitoxin module
MRILMLVLLLVTTVWMSGAQTILFEFKSAEDNRFVKETDSFKYYVASGDTMNTVGISEEFSMYKLFNEDMKVITEGDFIAEGDRFLKDGKWTAYFNSGRVKQTGYYRRNVPVGTWLEFYSDGKFRKITNYGIFMERGGFSACLSGTYQEFHKNGNLKVNGFYSAVLTEILDTIKVMDPVTSQYVYNISKRNGVKAERTGRWEYFEENGELQKKEEL